MVSGIGIAGTTVVRPEGVNDGRIPPILKPPVLITKEYKVPSNYLKLIGQPDAGKEIHWRMESESMEQGDGRSVLYIQQNHTLVVRASREEQKDAAAHVRAVWRKYRARSQKSKQ
jgi:hypothetical protein